MSRLSKISKKVTEFGLKRHNYEELKEIASKEGIVFWERNVPTSGIFIQGIKFKFIVINIKLNKISKAFTAAHELAHYFLGHSNDIFYGHISPTQSEFEANLIALIFLLPDKGMCIDLPDWESFFGGSRDQFFYELGIDIIENLKKACVEYRTKIEQLPLRDPTSNPIALKENMDLIAKRKAYIKEVINCKLFLNELSSLFPKK